MKRPTLHKLIFSILLFAISFLALFTSHKSSAFAGLVFFHHLPAFSFVHRTLFWNLPIFCLRNWIVYFCHSSVSFLDPDADQLHLQNVCPKKEPAWLGYGSSLLLLCGCLFTIYTFFCGINYGHTSFAEKYHLESGQYTLAELTSLCNELTDQLNTLSDSLDRDSDGLADMGKDLQDRARAAMFSVLPTLNLAIRN